MGPSCPLSSSLYSSGLLTKEEVPQSGYIHISWECEQH